jgi:hypothetical protein
VSNPPPKGLERFQKRKSRRSEARRRGTPGDVKRLWTASQPGGSQHCGLKQELESPVLRRGSVNKDGQEMKNHRQTVRRSRSPLRSTCRRSARHSHERSETAESGGDLRPAEYNPRTWAGAWTRRCCPDLDYFSRAFSDLNIDIEEIVGG